jgi:hypothetical protein
MENTDEEEEEEEEEEKKRREKYDRCNWKISPNKLRNKLWSQQRNIGKNSREILRWLRDKWQCWSRKFTARPGQWAAVYVTAVPRTQTVDVGFRSFFYFQEWHSKGRNVLAFARLFLTEKLQLTSCARRITKGKFHRRGKYRAINRHWSSGSHSFLIVKD